MRMNTSKTFVTCLFAIITVVVHAQIVLHEATDVTQTEATLSADFPCLSVEHGFQYKYGTLPEIDEFSRLALSSVSDPVQINTTDNSWSARTVKGWVESESNLSVGQAAIMSANVKFSEPTTVTFEWSVDSEEGIGILSFIVDGKTACEISGEVDFTQVSYQVSTGEHILQWQYKKTAAANVGLDLGMVKNIDLQNTMGGEWIDIPAYSSSVIVENLTPSFDYVYRAYLGTSHSNPLHFKTKEVSLQNMEIQSTSQTTANIGCFVEKGDANVKTGYILTKGEVPSNDLTLALLGNNPTTIKPTFDGGYWKCALGGVSCGKKTSVANRCNGSLQIVISIDTEKNVSFEWAAEAYDNLDFVFYLDGKKTCWITSSSAPKFTTKNITIPSGTHTLRWATSSNYQNGTYKNMVGYLRNLDLGESTSNIFYDDISQIIITGLIPNNTYSIQCFAEYENNLTQETLSVKSDWMKFETLKVLASILEAENVKHASATIKGKVDGGDATVIAVGLQYKEATGVRWTDYPKDVTETELSQNITRLKPSTTYHYRSYIQAQDCDAEFSEIGEFTTLAVEALKPTAIRIAQHEAELQGKVRFGDASIYQHGMQFRKSGETEWEEVEDSSNDSIYMLIKKNLEMGMKYEARTYIQLAGYDIIYSDILEFTTLDNYFTGSLKSPRTQTTVEFSATLADVDEDIAVEGYGFEYYLDSDGFFENAESFIKSDVVRIPVVPENGQITTTVTGLTPYYGLRFRAYIKINGEYIYYNSYGNQTWDFVDTERAAIKVSVKELTQTSVTLELDATQDGDAVVSQIEYAFANSVQDTDEYQVCGNELIINNLTPDTKYNLRFRGMVNGRLCPLLQDITWNYSWFEFATKAVTVSATFTNITQTAATMKVKVNAGDAEITDLRYSLNSGAYTDCNETVNFNGLKPGTQYTVSFTGKVNGTDCYWTTQPNIANAYKFTTKAISVSTYSSAIEQTSATIFRSYNCGDATYVSSGIDYGTTIAMTENASSEEDGIRLTELMPNTTYYWQAYVETEEGGRVYSSRNSFRTLAINCVTLPVSNISNRSATMNGTIDCDDYSSAEFGFQWKQMEGWNSDPVFTKGVKEENGLISVALVNGMLEPNTDYQYRSAVRYKGNIYYANSWETFRTESEFVYYPASVYTIYRTDRENNCLVLCGYYVAGSEDVVACGYEYWNTSASVHSRSAYAVADNIIQITTDASMQYSLDLKNLSDGTYFVRAFVKTSSGVIIYGETLSFGVQGGTIASIDNVETDEVRYSISNHVLSIYNAANMSCTIYNLQGQIVESRRAMTDNERFRFASGFVYIVRLSNGMIWKVLI